MRARVLLLVLSLFVVGLFKHELTAQKKPNVVLVTLDTTRADRMGFLGSTRGLTPNLDALAHDSIVFTRAYSQAPITTVSHATILTGTFPPAHRVNDFGNPLPGAVPYVPDLLHQQGYRTGAFVGSLILDPQTGTAPGFDRGFDVYDAGYRRRRPGEDRYRTLERRGDEVLARALAWATAQGRQPFFLWVHFFDPHDPYDPPADLKRRFASAPYDGEIAWVDRLVGRLVADFKAKGLSDQSMLVVAADHGEALGEHGEKTHGLFLYDETLHVPLMIRLPGREQPGKRVDARVRLADVAPTILEAAGIAVPAAVQGESLLPEVRLKPDATKPTSRDRPAYAETEYPRRGFGWAPLAAWRADRFLFVRAPRPELYDQISDAASLRNLVSSRGRVAEAMDRELRDFVVRSSGGAGADPKATTVDPEVAARLAALGYVSGSATAAPSGVDPKDNVAIANALHDAVVSVEDGDFAKAVPILEKVTATEPDIWIAQLNLGVARARQRQYARALAPLRKAIALQPDVMIARYELGVALYESGDPKSAAGELEIVASKMPKWADVRYSLGSVYARIDRVPDATRELQAAIDLEPRHFRANLLLGRILALSGRADAAVPHLRTAVDVQPSSAEAHDFLADAYEKVGDRVAAAAERQRAEQARAKKPAA
jgi:arylsulfatase A-like enzyme/Flp pilus assembly protein TadD